MAIFPGSWSGSPQVIQIGQIDSDPAPIVLLKMKKPDRHYDPPFFVEARMRHLEPLGAIDLLGNLTE